MPQQNQTREEFVTSLFQIKEEDNIHSNETARTGLIKGISKVVTAIKASYGPHGSNAIIQAHEYPFHKTVNDGKAIAESIVLKDKIENIGANLVKETADKSDKESGDGRKTSMILLDAILSEGQQVNVPPMDLKRSLDECLPLIIENINKQTVQITEKEVGSIAKVASESEELGKLFQEIYTKIGKDGIVELDNSSTGETYYEITQGVKLLNCGYHFSYMVNDTKRKSAVYMNPLVLIVKQKISNIFDLDKILKKVSDMGKDELVIFCDEIDMQVSQALSYLHHGVTPTGQTISAFKTLVIKAPVLWKDWLFEDFAKITGATVIDVNEGRSLKSFQMSYLGKCDKIVTTKDQTIVLGTKNITDHLAYLKSQEGDDAKIRHARLQTKTAILKVGSNSETELSYLKGKALDARNSSYLALQHGVVLGGGISYINVIDSLPNTIGGKILKKALSYPYLHLSVNKGSGYNDHDMQQAKIYDSAIVVKNAITNALSVASTILTTQTVITK